MFITTYWQLDKAALLAEVINHVKLLKTTATEHAKGYTIPSDTDEVTILCEPQTANTTNTSFLIRASICCDDSPELYPELKQSLQNLHARVVRAEISSLSGRVKIVFFIIPERVEGNGEMGRKLLVDSVQHALRSALERVNSSMEFMPRDSLLNKRRRVSHFESSSSSSWKWDCLCWILLLVCSVISCVIIWSVCDILFTELFFFDYVHVWNNEVFVDTVRSRLMRI